MDVLDVFACIELVRAKLDNYQNVLLIVHFVFEEFLVEEAKPKDIPLMRAPKHPIYLWIMLLLSNKYAGLIPF